MAPFHYALHTWACTFLSSDKFLYILKSTAVLLVTHCILYVCISSYIGEFLFNCERERMHFRADHLPDGIEPIDAKTSSHLPSFKSYAALHKPRHLSLDFGPDFGFATLLPKCCWPHPSICSASQPHCMSKPSQTQSKQNEMKKNILRLSKGSKAD